MNREAQASAQDGYFPRAGKRPKPAQLLSKLKHRGKGVADPVYRPPTQHERPPTRDAVGHLLAVLQEHVLADDLRHKEPLRQLAHNVLGWAGMADGVGDRTPAVLLRLAAAAVVQAHPCCHKQAPRPGVTLG